LEWTKKRITTLLVRLRIIREVENTEGDELDFGRDLHKRSMKEEGKL